MESRASTTIRQSAKKVRFVLQEVKRENVNSMLSKLQFMNKKAAINILKTLKSAFNNFQQQHPEEDIDSLFIKDAFVNQGPTMKRFRPAAMGRAVRILKRTSNLTIVVSNKVSGV